MRLWLFAKHSEGSSRFFQIVGIAKLLAIAEEGRVRLQQFVETWALMDWPGRSSSEDDWHSIRGSLINNMVNEYET